MHNTAPSQDGAFQVRSRLLQLPGELRNQILRYVVTQPEPINLWHVNAQFDIDVRIMYVCKQLRDEARFFLYRENTLEVGVESKGMVTCIISSKGMVTSLHFSRHHMLCEYRGKEAVQEVLSLYVERFSNFRFTFADARHLESLRRALDGIKDRFHGKHIEIILPPPREPRTANQAPATAPRVSLYPRITSPVSCFSIIRCASLSVASPAPKYDSAQHDKLVELVTSNRPVLDLMREYEDAERSARNVVKMLIPGGCLQEYELLGDQAFAHLAAMCEYANKSDQDAFVAAKEEFERCYREIEELQWRSV